MIEFLLLLQFLSYINCQDNITMEDTALFFKTETQDGERDPETDKSVQTILTWLQKRYKNQGERKARTNEQFLQHEYDSATMEPRPFAFNDAASILNSDLSSESPVTSTELPTSNEIFPPTIQSLNVECQKDRMTVDIEFTSEFSGIIYSKAHRLSSVKCIATANNNGDIYILSIIFPPTIQSLNVECQKDRMTVDIEFTSKFSGVIYSKDHYTNPECRYVVADSHSQRYRFTVQLNSCGTQFVNDFDKGGQAYLENVLVIQNEPGILEIWDSIRSVRCQWEGSIRQQVTSGLSVVTPSTELVTFSGDTATAKLEIQTGKGPFAFADPKPAMIGDMMTLVISVEGDPEHMIRVGRCTAAGGGQEMQLSDDAGCPVRPKLMTGFEYTRNPQTNGAMAFSYFRAFKFPDSNELNFDCNVELCKTPCVPCQDHANGLHHRKKRSSVNTTDSLDDNDILRIRNKLWIASPSTQINSPDVCMTSTTFYVTTFFIMSLLLVALSSAFHLYITSKKLKGEL